MPWSPIAGISALRLPLGLVDGARAQSSESEPAPLVETQGVDVVIRRDDPQPPAAVAGGEVADRGDQRRAHAGPLADRVEREDLALAVALDVREEAGRLSRHPSRR